MIRKKVPITKIAEELKISVSTVSRALSNHPRISQETKSKVIELAEKLNYFQTLPTQAMSKKQRYLLLLVPNCSLYISKLLMESISSSCKKNAYNMLVMEYSGDTIIENLRYCYSLPICGTIIYLDTTEEINFSQVNLNNTPTILMGNMSENLPYPKLVVDYFMCTYQAVKHLLHQGCKKIIYLAGDEDSVQTRMYKNGFQKATEHLSPDDIKVLHSNLLEVDLEDCIKYCINHHMMPDAFIIEDENCTFLLIDLLEAASFSIPSKVKIISLHDNDLLQNNTPSITAVFEPIADMGRSAVQLLHQHLLSESKFQKSSLLVTKPHVVIRSSSLS